MILLSNAGILRAPSEDFSGGITYSKMETAVDIRNKVRCAAHVLKAFFRPVPVGIRKMAEAM